MSICQVKEDCSSTVVMVTVLDSFGGSGNNVGIINSTLHRATSGCPSGSRYHTVQRPNDINRYLAKIEKLTIRIIVYVKQVMIYVRIVVLRKTIDKNKKMKDKLKFKIERLTFENGKLTNKQAKKI